MVDVAAVPNGLEYPVGKTEDQDVLHRLFAKVVIDAIDLLFVEDGVDRLVQRLGTLQVVAEGLLDYDPFPALGRPGNAGGSEPVDDDRKELGGGRQVEDAVTCRSALAIQSF